jgi:hypothetical protein
MRRALIMLLPLAACTTAPPMATMTHGTVPRDARGDPVLSAVPPAPEALPGSPGPARLAPESGSAAGPAPPGA